MSIRKDDGYRNGWFWMTSIIFVKNKEIGSIDVWKCVKSGSIQFEIWFGLPHHVGIWNVWSVNSARCIKAHTLMKWWNRFIEALFKVSSTNLCHLPQQTRPEHELYAVCTCFKKTGRAFEGRKLDRNNVNAECSDSKIRLDEDERKHHVFLRKSLPFYWCSCKRHQFEQVVSDHKQKENKKGQLCV